MSLLTRIEPIKACSASKFDGCLFFTTFEMVTSLTIKYYANITGYKEKSYTLIFIVCGKVILTLFCQFLLKYLP